MINIKDAPERILSYSGSDEDVGIEYVRSDIYEELKQKYINLKWGMRLKSNVVKAGAMVIKEQADEIYELKRRLGEE